MEPGREMDALVAEKVMRWLYVQDGTGHPPIQEDENELYSSPRIPVPPYSTDIAAAWEVVEKLREDRETIFRLERPVGPGYLCTFRMENLPEWAGTAPHAICLAALKAVNLGDRTPKGPGVAGGKVLIIDGGTLVGSNFLRAKPADPLSTDSSPT